MAAVQSFFLPTGRPNEFRLNWAALVEAGCSDVKCPKCKVTVPLDKIDMPNRCHAKCPLNRKDETS